MTIVDVDEDLGNVFVKEKASEGLKYFNLMA